MIERPFDSTLLLENIPPWNKFEVKFEEVPLSFNASFIENQENIKFEFGEFIVIHEGERYQGEYSITPRAYEQTLECEEKLMSHDVTVYQIPYSAVDNVQGGITVNIGG